MKRYRLLVWCTDCKLVEDEQGCFDGAVESMDTYDTYEQAYDEGEKLIEECSFWEYSIETYGVVVER